MKKEAKQKTSKLNSRLGRLGSYGTEKKDTAQKVVDVLEKTENNKKLAELEKIENIKLNKDVISTALSIKNANSQRVSDLRNNADKQVVCGGADGGCRVGFSADVKKAGLSKEEQKQYKKDTGVDPNVAQTAQANLEQAANNKMLEQLTNDEYWKPRYDIAHASLSQLFYPDEMTKSGEPKLIEAEQFQTIVHALMSSPDIQSKIQTRAKEDR